MAGNVSNAKELFEDWDAVLLHDEQIARNETDWKFQDDVLQNPEPCFLDGYIKKYSKASPHWGVKTQGLSVFK
ncbi:hypothetical protein [Enterovibrio norvegicus]|uniref:hypothetical protein n=1 Tax=Enterovibrio norvegicus TaxID=188144 RepID=UPI0010BF2C8F|nr:hypothetical protein [Enterovibrio norvegicus]TKF30074.1 hypothetical protein FCV83_19960 [Enterovibrio norvegicus]